MADKTERAIAEWERVRDWQADNRVAWTAAIVARDIRNAGDALAAELAAAEKRTEELEAALTKITSVVDAQAEDEALWALYPMGEQPISEAYLQQELRHLHTVIEAAVSEGKP